MGLAFSPSARSCVEYFDGSQDDWLMTLSEEVQKLSMGDSIPIPLMTKIKNALKSTRLVFDAPGDCLRFALPRPEASYQEEVATVAFTASGVTIKAYRIAYHDFKGSQKFTQSIKGRNHAYFINLFAKVFGSARIEAAMKTGDLVKGAFVVKGVEGESHLRMYREDQRRADDVLLLRPDSAGEFTEIETIAH